MKGGLITEGGKAKKYGRLCRRFVEGREYLRGSVDKLQKDFSCIEVWDMDEEIAA